MTGQDTCMCLSTYFRQCSYFLEKWILRDGVGYWFESFQTQAKIVRFTKLTYRAFNVVLGASVAGKDEMYTVTYDLQRWLSSPWKSKPNLGRLSIRLAPWERNT